MSDVLQRVRDLQNSDQAAAEMLLLSFIHDELPLDVVSLELTPLAVSLNSFNGFMILRDGRRLFFKSHTETDTVINEYYNAGLMADAGYPIIQPVFQSTEPGKQFLAYEVIDDLSVFDVAWQIENSRADNGTFETLTQSQNRSDDELLQLYLQTLTFDDSDTQSPIHQLFYHRLVHGRLERFYGVLPGNFNTSESPAIKLPGYTDNMRDVRQMKWVINGRIYNQTLDDIIQQAVVVLNPDKSDNVRIIGHGDAHNGNVFFRQQSTPPSLLYFDPAFAGSHHPLLDLTKPLFHNVFAMWMYFPDEKHDNMTISLEQQSNTFIVEHDYDLHAVREIFWESKATRVLQPILAHLKQAGQLRDDWQIFLKAALFCCPFLTMNLADNERFPPEISLLGLTMAVEMGADSPRNNPNKIDELLYRLADNL